MERMTVEIWSDIACPWCYIGKRRFESALARFEHRDDVDVLWRSYQLDPGAPRRYDGTVYDLVARKYGRSPAEAAAMHEQVTALAAAEGLTYRFDRTQPGNTFDAHRLLHLAQARGLQGPVKERLLHAYFTEGVAIGDPDALVAVVADAGLDAAEARAVLAGDAYADDVRTDMQRAAALGIRGVPFFVIDERYGVSGAQPADLFLDALRQAWAESHPITFVNGATGDGVCEGDECALPAAPDVREAPSATR
jgi:predicted DsbA family dithiol-disulfide isomerase